MEIKMALYQLFYIIRSFPVLWYVQDPSNCLLHGRKNNVIQKYKTLGQGLTEKLCLNFFQISLYVQPLLLKKVPYATYKIVGTPEKWWKNSKHINIFFHKI